MPAFAAGTSASAAAMANAPSCGAGTLASEPPNFPIGVANTAVSNKLPTVSGNASVVLNEKDKAYVDVTDNLTFLKDNSFIWTSEKDGYNHIYLYDKKGKLKNQVTQGNWEVTSYYGFDEKTKTVFYQSVEKGSILRDVYKISLDGKKKVRLSSQTGTNVATFSPDFSLFINSFSSVAVPTFYTLNSAIDGKQVQEIVNNNTLLDKLKKYS